MQTLFQPISKRYQDIYEIKIPLNLVRKGKINSKYRKSYQNAMKIVGCYSCQDLVNFNTGYTCSTCKKSLCKECYHNYEQSEIGKQYQNICRCAFGKYEEMKDQYLEYCYANLELRCIFEECKIRMTFEQFVDPYYHQDCGKRRYKCNCCRAVVWQEDQRKHQMVCPDLPKQCDICKLYLREVEIADHIKKCTNTPGANSQSSRAQSCRKASSLEEEKEGQLFLINTSTTPVFAPTNSSKDEQKLQEIIDKSVADVSETVSDFEQLILQNKDLLIEPPVEENQQQEMIKAQSSVQADVIAPKSDENKENLIQRKKEENEQLKKKLKEKQKEILKLKKELESMKKSSSKRKSKELSKQISKAEKNIQTDLMTTKGERSSKDLLSCTACKIIIKSKHCAATFCDDCIFKNTKSRYTKFDLPKLSCEDCDQLVRAKFSCTNNCKPNMAKNSIITSGKNNEQSEISMAQSPIAMSQQCHSNTLLTSKDHKRTKKPPVEVKTKVVLRGKKFNEVEISSTCPEKIGEFDFDREFSRKSIGEIKLPISSATKGKDLLQLIYGSQDNEKIGEDDSWTGSAHQKTLAPVQQPKFQSANMRLSRSQRRQKQNSNNGIQEILSQVSFGKK